MQTSKNIFCLKKKRALKKLDVQILLRYVINLQKLKCEEEKADAAIGVSLRLYFPESYTASLAMTPRQKHDVVAAFFQSPCQSPQLLKC